MLSAASAPAARVERHELETREGMADDVVEVVEMTLAEPPAASS